MNTKIKITIGLLTGLFIGLLSAGIAAADVAYVVSFGSTSLLNTGALAVIPTSTDVPTLVTDPGGSLSAAVTPDNTRVYNTHHLSGLPVDGTVSEYDTATNQIKASIKVGGDPRGIAISHNGKRAYVSTGSPFTGVTGGYSVAVIDIDPLSPTFNTVIANTIIGGDEESIAVSADDSTVYVSGGFAIATISTATFQVTNAIRIFNLINEVATGVATAPNGNWWVSTTNSNGTSGHLLEFNSANALIASIALPVATNNVTISPDGRTVWAVNGSASQVTRVDASTATITRTILIPGRSGTGAFPLGAATTFDGTKLYLADPGDDTVTVVDATNNSVKSTLTGVGHNVFGVAMLYGSIPQPAFDFSISQFLSTTINAGDSYVATGQLTLTKGTTQPVALSATGLPPGATVTFTPTSCNPNCSFNLVIQTDPNLTPGGTYTITVTGTGGSQTHSATFNLTVQPFNFSMSASPNSGTVTAGNVTTSTIGITQTAGKTQPVTLSADPRFIPPGVVITFTPNSVTPNGSSVASIQTSASTPSGTYQIPIVGTAGSGPNTVTHSTVYTLTVIQGIAPGQFVTNDSCTLTNSGTVTITSFTLNQDGSIIFTVPANGQATGKCGTATGLFLPGIYTISTVGTNNLKVTSSNGKVTVVHGGQSATFNMASELEISGNDKFSLVCVRSGTVSTNATISSNANGNLVASRFVNSDVHPVTIIPQLADSWTASDANGAPVASGGFSNPSANWLQDTNNAAGDKNDCVSVSDGTASNLTETLSGVTQTKALSGGRLPFTVVQKSGKLFPANQQTLIGSELNIYSPESIPLTAAIDVPFVYETPNNYWTVSSSLTPPTGCTVTNPASMVTVDQSVGATAVTLSCSVASRSKASLTALSDKASDRAHVVHEVRDCTKKGCPPQRTENDIKVTHGKAAKAASSSLIPLSMREISNILSQVSSLLKLVGSYLSNL